jgi:hypothetical protein
VKAKPHKKSNTPVIVAAVIGSAAAIFAVIGIAAFVQRRRRRRWNRPRSILSTSSDSLDDGTGTRAIVTPFNPSPSEATQDSGIWAEQQPLVSENAGAEMVALHGLSSTPPISLPRSRPVAPNPAGVSSKEIARLRAEALSSQASHNRSTSNVSQSASSGAASSYDPQRLHSEVESLRREMERLRTEVVVEAPPSYTEGDR